LKGKKMETLKIDGANSKIKDGFLIEIFDGSSPRIGYDDYCFRLTDLSQDKTYTAYGDELGQLAHGHNDDVEIVGNWLNSLTEDEWKRTKHLLNLTKF